jgi:hypothetical protein
MMDKYMYAVGLMCLLTGCSFRDAGYTALGAGAGAGIGYSIGHNTKDAVIGGLGGALVGNLAAQWQDKSDKTKADKSYKEGYNQARVDVATQNWDDNTGKGADPQKQVITVLVPKDEEDGIIYDQRELILEDNQ